MMAIQEDADEHHLETLTAVDPPTIFPLRRVRGFKELQEIESHRGSKILRL